jgi:hypothetical protein
MVRTRTLTASSQIAVLLPAVASFTHHMNDASQFVYFYYKKKKTKKFYSEHNESYTLHPIIPRCSFSWFALLNRNRVLSIRILTLACRVCLECRPRLWCRLLYIAKRRICVLQERSHPRCRVRGPDGRRQPRSDSFAITLSYVRAESFRGEKAVIRLEHEKRGDKLSVHRVSVRGGERRWRPTRSEVIIVVVIVICARP